MNKSPAPNTPDTIRCADCIRSDGAVTDLRPTSVVPIPEDALHSFPDGVPSKPRGLSRRTFIRGGTIGFAAVYSAAHLGYESIWHAAAAEAATGANNTVVVSIYLQGGNDGLNCVVPVDSTNYAAYQAARSNIARLNTPSVGSSVGTWALPNSQSLGFAAPLTSNGSGDSKSNKSSLGLDTLWGDGTAANSDLAIFPATDYSPPDLSHFESRDYWFAGEIDNNATTGWLGRWLDLYGSSTNPLQAISLGSDLSKSIRTASAPVCAISGLGGNGFQIPNTGTNANPNMTQLADIPVGDGNVALARARSIWGETVEVAKQVSTIQPGTPFPGYPQNSYLADQLQLASTLLGAQLGTRVITIDWGSFDTHGNEVESQDPQLAELSQCLAAFKADLAARNIEQNVVTLVYSEFGRRVVSNDSLGTDHGAGGFVMVAGSSVAGGQAGEHPGVLPGNLDDNGDLMVVTDFRTVYQALLTEWLGPNTVDPTQVLPGGPFPGIARYDGGTHLIKQ